MSHKRFAVILLAVVLAGCSFSMFGKTKAVRQHTLSGERGPKLAVVDLEGLLVEEGRGPFGIERPSPVSRLRETLDHAARDKDVAGLILRIRSPGGTVSASEVMHHEIQLWKRRTGRPVVAYLEGVAASGGYFVAMSADALVAHPTTVTGSIGVILWNVNLSGLMAKLGIVDQTFTSGRYKDSGSPLREMEEGEREIIQGVIDDFHGRFTEVVAAGRPQLVGHQLEEACDGRIFSATQALDAGLIDEIGHFEAAARLLEGKLGISQSRIVAYTRPGEYRSNIHTGPASPTLEVNLLTIGGRHLEPGFYYLWLPQGP